MYLGTFLFTYKTFWIIDFNKKAIFRLIGLIFWAIFVVNRLRRFICILYVTAKLPFYGDLLNKIDISWRSSTKIANYTLLKSATCSGLNVSVRPLMISFHRFFENSFQLRPITDFVLINNLSNKSLI